MLYNTIKNNDKNFVPIWFLRQSGRHLKEYYNIRKTNDSFIDFCLDEKKIVEATFLPLKYYDLDAAIIFSDILLIPWVLGQEVRFEKNIGPILQPINDCRDINNKFTDDDFKPLTNAIKLVKKRLPEEKNLIGFSGAPWTLACYMIEGQSSKNFERIKTKIWDEDEFVSDLINILIENVEKVLYLQAKAGADVLMIFDTWSHMIPDSLWKLYAIDPIRKIIYNLRKKNIFCPIIGFPFKAGEKLIQYSYETNVDVISLDWKADIKWVKDNINSEVVLQGNLDPLLLTTNNHYFIEKEVYRILNVLKDRVHIFNIGHGITPNAKVENIKYVIDIVRNYKK